MLRQLNRPDEAAAAFRRCMDIPATSNLERKTRADCLFYLGTLRFRDGKWADAAAMMESVVGADPQRAEARYYLGMAYRRLGRDAEAREQLAIHGRLLEAERSAGVIRRRDGP